ncbi:MHS family MFS transporter [Diaphorobacter ruginosibacter]|uniref:MHS family MFS transporter n=1 Tax=Diaphorobacter ruginosibacter TaxID=1715720 RepID=A0A7G9RK72_9BURK|nr:MFS transporter [Diaphorobacter ruginosibacter]QNN55997.1 MHS family MFS transporter [Diaphorobacter ruginosibacter]
MQTTISGSAATPAVPTNSVRKVAAASLAGTTLEFYDHFIYGTAAALVFPRLFFPQGDPLVSTLLSFASYGVAFVARPMGAAIFGHFGDKIGRKSILFVTLMMMGLATFGIGLLPGYETLGILAPILLVLLRIIQGTALGGEWGGATIMVNELDPTGKRRGLLGSVVQMAAPIGLLLANGVFAVVTKQLSDEQFLSWGWRIPFLMSSLLVIIGLYIRAQVNESALFEKLEAKGEESPAPIKELLTHYKRKLLIGFGARLGGDISFYVFTLFLLYYVPTKLGLPKDVALYGVLAGAVAQIIFIPIAGWLCDRLGRRPVLMFGGLGGAAWTFAFFALIETRNPTLIVLAAFVGMGFVSFMFSPLASFLPELFATRVRVTGASLGFQFAGVFGGALAPIICTSLLAAYSSTFPVAIYCAVACALIAVAAWSARETARAHLNEIDSR